MNEFERLRLPAHIQKKVERYYGKNSFERMHLSPQFEKTVECYHEKCKHLVGDGKANKFKEFDEEDDEFTLDALLPKNVKQIYVCRMSGQADYSHSFSYDHTCKDDGEQCRVALVRLLPEHYLGLLEKYQLAK